MSNVKSVIRLNKKPSNVNLYKIIYLLRKVN